MKMSIRRVGSISNLAFAVFAGIGQVEASDLPTVPEEFEVELFAKEPLIRNAGSMAFDSRGRLFVGYGPQYRKPKPDTPGDSVAIMIDSDGDGVADKSKVFATGFNCIQGLAWHGKDLWVGNSPDLTVVRDLDGDDVADEYVRVYTDLGNIEHANHGHNWAPDGKLYFSNGNSKGLSLPGRVAPKPFRDMWGIGAPEGSPDFPEPQTFQREGYQRTYQDPRDNWGREGGVFRCDDMGKNLELVSRGTRNVYDIGFDSGFNWLGTDNDQSEGDRVIMPFFNAHFGWGHSWSSHWTGENHLPTVPISGPVFHGSGTGVIYYDHPSFPEAYRGVWFINDWSRNTTFVYRPTWDGALVQPEGGAWSAFAKDGSNVGSGGQGLQYQPVDIVIGPDGALYVTGWGSEYGAVWKDGEQVNEGRILRISWKGAPKTGWNSAKRAKTYSGWSFDELFEDLGSILPVWNIDAQDELTRRGGSVVQALQKRLSKGGLSEAAETWAIWTLGRISVRNSDAANWLDREASALSLNARIQAIRIAGYRIRESSNSLPMPALVLRSLEDEEPRIRFAAVQAVEQAGLRDYVPHLLSVAAKETDRITYYAAWRAIDSLASTEELNQILTDDRPGARRAALLALLEKGALSRGAVESLLSSGDAATSPIAAEWIAKQSGNTLINIYPQPGPFVDSVRVKLTPGIKPSRLRFTTDGSEPTLSSKEGEVTFEETTTLKVALFVDEKKIGNTLVARYAKIESGYAKVALEGVTRPTTASEVLDLLDGADLSQGPGVFNAAGCVACHRVGDMGQQVGPDLSAIGDGGDPKGLIDSILFPGNIVVEGYSLLAVSTSNGGSYSGILDSETGSHLRLIQLDGSPVAIDKTVIQSRESTHLSPMPPYQSVLNPKQLSELVAWLMSKRSL